MTYRLHSKRNVMNRAYLLVAIFFLTSTLQAQPMMDVDTASGYLMVTTEQQEIYLGRFLNANQNIVNQCQPGWGIAKSNDYFIAWVNDHPQYLRRNITSAFSAALLESCKLTDK